VAIGSVCTWVRINLPLFLSHQLNFFCRRRRLSAIELTDSCSYCIPPPSRQARLRRAAIFRLDLRVALLEFLIAVLTEFVFFLADDENGTRRSEHNSFSRCANAQMAAVGIAVGRDHDKIDVQILGHFVDLVRCMPDSHR
jgi:hypothetical protein